MPLPASSQCPFGDITRMWPRASTIVCKANPNPNPNAARVRFGGTMCKAGRRSSSLRHACCFTSLTTAVFRSRTRLVIRGDTGAPRSARGQR
eukprot:2849712-Prymnesium_polylepis.1